MGYFLPIKDVSYLYGIFYFYMTLFLCVLILVGEILTFGARNNIVFCLAVLISVDPVGVYVKLQKGKSIETGPTRRRIPLYIHCMPLPTSV